MHAIDPAVSIRPVCEFLTKENAAGLMADADLVVDALDNAAARLVLEDAASEAESPCRFTLRHEF